MKVASVPPDVIVPAAGAPQPTSCVIQPMTRSSNTVAVGDISHTAMELLSALMTTSLQTAAASGAET